MGRAKSYDIIWVGIKDNFEQGGIVLIPVKLAQRALPASRPWFSAGCQSACRGWHTRSPRLRHAGCWCSSGSSPTGVIHGSRVTWSAAIGWHGDHVIPPGFSTSPVLTLRPQRRPARHWENVQDGYLCCVYTRQTFHPAPIGRAGATDTESATDTDYGIRRNPRHHATLRLG